MRLKRTALALLAISLASASVRANDWAQWRGPEQDGVSRETNLPTTWSPDGNVNVVWKIHAGGMSSPIVMGGIVYTLTRTGEVPAGEGATTTLDPGPQTKETFIACDAKTGEKIWEHSENMFQTDVPFHRLGWSNPAGDPQSGLVYALGTQCALNCFDAKTGKIVWSRHMTEEFGMISTFGGRTTSPMVDEDQLFVTGVSFGWGNNAGSQHRIFAFDKKTGALNWTAGSGGIPVDAPYGTPVVGVINGERTVIFQGGDGGVHAFQARTGKKLWTFKASKRGWSASVTLDGNRVYAHWDLDNFDSNKLGRVVCLDASQVVNGSPKEVWRQDGIEAGFPSATLADGTLYVANDSAVVYAIDAATGKIKYKKGFGTVGKASLVYADGKLYFPEGNGRFWILEPGEKKFNVLSHVDIEEKMAREYNIFGSVAISDGHVFLATANDMYCIGPKEFTKQDVPIPAPANKEEPIGTEKPAADIIQVVPADLVLHPGQKQTFTARAFDAKGRPLGDVKPSKWEVGQLVLPPVRARPTALIRPSSVFTGQPATGTGGAGSSLAPATDKPAGTPAPPGGDKPAPAPSGPATVPPPPGATTKPILVGNLKGEIDADGTYTAAAPSGGPLEGGAIIAAVGNLRGEARVRVMPPLPWTFDFEKDAVGRPPLTWIGAGMKFAVRDLDGNKVLVKLTDIPLFARARTFFGSTEMSDYTVQGDVMVKDTVFNNGGTVVRKSPDAGLIDSRYVLELKGANNTAGIYAWPAALPRDETQPGLASHKVVPFDWKSDTWYRLKISVQQGEGKATVRGKVWLAKDPEPQPWLVEMEDPNPNTHGSPGLWGFSNDHEIYYDNLSVTPNAAAAHAAAK